MKFRFGVRVLPREVILDTQGRAVEKTLEIHHFQNVHVRVGKWIEVEVEESSEQKAKEKVFNIAKEFLYNPLLETFEVLPAGSQ